MNRSGAVGLTGREPAANPQPQPQPQPRFDRLAKLRNLLQVLAFCLALAAIQVAFAPQRSYGTVTTYSLCIGIVSWAVIDLGRDWFPSARETGWPRDWMGPALVLAGIAAGYVIGSLVADAVCLALGLYPPDALRHKPDLTTDLLITALAGLIGSGYFYAQGKGAWLERQADEARRTAASSRLKLLEVQLEPHMLFNTLANLRALIGTDPPRAQAMLDRLDAYLRATLGGSRAATHSLADEFARLDDYLALMAIRMGERLSFCLTLPPELASQPVPTLLLQPLVENAIRHGLEPQVAGGRVAVLARREGRQLVLEVEDTGVGLPDTPRAQGFGLEHVRERLHTLYGSAASLELKPARPMGTQATLQLPWTSA